MSSDVVLSAALRNNLLSLQSTQKGIDSSQLKLSTGKKVNSALDNAQSYFASEALTNRASDLSKLLDGIGQSIEVIKAADNGVTALTSLISQAQAIASSAQDQLSSISAGAAKVTGTNNVGSTTLGYATATAGYFTTGDTFKVTSVDSAGVKNAQTITVATGDTGFTLANKITAAFAGNKSEVAASIDSTSGALTIQGSAGYSFRIDSFTGGAGASAATSQAVLNNLGIGTNFTTETAGTATTTTGATFNGNGSTIQSAALTTTGSVLATASTQIKNLTGFSNIDAATDTFTLATASGSVAIDLFTGSTTIQSLVDQINNSTSLNGSVKASFDTTTGQLNLQVTDPSVKYVKVGTGSSVETLGFGFGSKKVDGQAGAAAGGSTEVIAVNTASTQVAALQNQYNSIRTQIDSLVTNGDTGYRGTNLLNGDNLQTTFNEGRTSTLTTKGQTFTSAGLGISKANFTSASSITSALSQINSALSSVRSFGSGLASDLSTIQTRQTFTSSMINTLNEGSSALVDADTNEEGAKLLALQTRQSLGVTALSLASQSAQSVLRLFS